MERSEVVNIEIVIGPGGTYTGSKRPVQLGDAVALADRRPPEVLKETVNEPSVGAFPVDPSMSRIWRIA